MQARNSTLLHTHQVQHRQHYLRVLEILRSTPLTRRDEREYGSVGDELERRALLEDAGEVMEPIPGHQTSARFIPSAIDLMRFGKAQNSFRDVTQCLWKTARTQYPRRQRLPTIFLKTAFVIS